MTVASWKEFVRQLMQEKSSTLRGPGGTGLDQDMLKQPLLLPFMETGSDPLPWLLGFAICPISSGTTNIWEKSSHAKCFKHKYRRVEVF